MSKFYKIRHKATGLFYKPCSGRGDTNLSKAGKAYQTKPSTAYLYKIRLGFGAVGQPYQHTHGIPNPEIVVDFNPEEWELLKFETSEIAIPW